MRDYLSDKPYRRTVNIIVNNLLHTSHAINFLLYIYSAPSFRAELLKIFTDLKIKFSKAKPNQIKNFKTEMINNNRNNFTTSNRTDYVAVTAAKKLTFEENEMKFLNPNSAALENIELVDIRI